VETVGTLKILIISDIHSNLTAFEGVLKDAGRYDMAICAGDIVGYGPDPKECVETIIRQNIRCVAGNHDVAIVSGDVSRFNAYAAEAIAVNRRLLGYQAQKWLRSLPHNLSLKFDEIKTAIFHGSPLDPINEYVFPQEAARRGEYYFELTGADLIILGHTHVPFIHRSGRYILLNPGSVGQPRDGDPRSSYMMVDIDDGEIKVSYMRVEYDIGEVASRMRHLGLPEMLAVRLYSGW
jgi:putative phosphoesterase